MHNFFKTVSRRNSTKISRSKVKPLADRPGVEQLEVRENPTGVYSGVAFQDYNANGIRELTELIQNGGTANTSIGAAIDRGIGNVVVSAFNAAGAAGNTTTLSDGTFSFTPTGAGPYRFEFSLANLPSGWNPGPQGPDSGTPVQFVADGGGSNLRLGLVRRDAYSVTNPLIVTSIFNYGNPLDTITSAANPNFGDSPSIQVFRYSDGGTSNPGYLNPAPAIASVPHRRVGAVYGLAVDQTTRDVYASAYFKKFSGFGPNGTGAIYRFNLPAGTPSNFTPPAGSLLYADINAIFGANTAGANQHDTVDDNANGFADDYDFDNGNAAWDAVGKTGFGGMDISTDGRFLYTVNLADRQVYRIPTSGPLDATTIQRVSIPLSNPDATASIITAARFRSNDLRPFAVRYHEGQVYVGFTYTAETLAGGPNDVVAGAELMAGVYRLNPITLAFDPTPIFTMSLDYQRDQSSTGFSSQNITVSPWRPWRPTYFSTSGNNSFGVAPQAMFSDISFDAIGNMTMAFRDRGADANGFFTLSDAANPTRRIEGFTTGDMLQAFVNTPNNLASGWTLESNGRGPASQGTPGTATQNSGAGPGGAEFYFNETFGLQANGNVNHGETSNGALLQVPGRPDVISTQMDPGTDVRAGGVSWMNTRAGSEAKAYQLFISVAPGSNPTGPSTQDDTFGKANGMGGLAGVFGLSPVEIGNRIWLDTDADGIQDANENGLSGIVVQLLDAGGATVGEATTDTTGNYYFSSALGLSTNAKRFGLTLVEGETYVVRVPNIRGASRQALLNGRALTIANADSTSGGDERDSDGTTVGVNADITYIAGTAAQNNQTLDFGFTEAYSLGNRVWRDLNDSGSIDAADGATPGIFGVVLRLYRNADTTGAVASATTDVNGYYLFDALPAGNYTVEVDRTSANLAGLTSSTPRIPDPNANTLDSRNNGATVAAGTVRSGIVTLGPGASEPTGEGDLGPAGNGATLDDAHSNQLLDFGFISPAVYSLGGNIFYDSNNDGNIAGETLITGQNITLVLSGNDAAGNAVSRTVTTTNGTYNFTGLPASGVGGFTVTQFNQPTGFLDGKDKAGTPFGGTLVAAQDKITGIVIAAGTPTGTAGINYNFGELLPASLGNFVWLDVNGNGRQDGGAEIGIDGISVTLSGTDDLGAAVSKVLSTAGGGAYNFTNLRPGSYAVTFGNVSGPTTYVRTVQNSSVAAGATNSDGNAATGLTSSVTLVAGQNNPDIDQGLYLPSSLGNRVFYDANGDGLQQVIEPGLPGSKIVVTWFGPDGVSGGGDDTTFPTVTAGTDGLWTLDNIPPGNYSVVVTPLPGLPVFTDSLDDTVLSPFNPVVIAVPSGTTRFDIDFGFRGNASFGDTVWHDINNNGTQDAGEPGLPAVPVVLVWYGADGVLGGGDDYTATATTDSNGKYLFSNLPAGNYRATVTTSALPANFVQTFDLDGLGTASQADTTLTNAQARRDVDFGYRGVGTIGDLVWYDVDGNGVQDNSTVVGFEPGIPGAVVTLTFGGADGNLATSADNLTYTTTTDANGNYLFPGLFTANNGTTTQNYRVVVAPPAAYTTLTFDADNISTPNTSALVLTNAAAVNLLQDFGYNGNAGLGNFVWLDVNGNGRQDTGEAGLNGVNIQLLDATGKVLDVRTTSFDGTGALGFYEFRNLIPGTYSVLFGNSVGNTTYVRTIQNSPVASVSTDSNADRATGRSAPVTLATSEFNPTLDAGLYLLTSLGDTVWYDVNRNGSQQLGEPGLSGVVVVLDAAGPDAAFGTADDLIGSATTTTSASGVYNFASLAPGVYRTRVDAGTLPNGLTQATFDLDGLGTLNQADGVVPSGTPRLDFDFGYVGTASLGDTVWLDLDRNGFQSNNEPGIPGVRVNLTFAGFDNQFGTADDIAFASQTTGADGKYLFAALPTGNFRAAVDATSLPQPYVATFDLDSGTSNPDAATATTLTVGQARRNVDFGFTGTGAIGDRIWLDRDGDGTQDPGEPGLPNIPLKLVYAGPDNLLGNGDDVTLTTTTNADGNYLFSGLPGGKYSVMPLNIPPGLTLTGDPEGPLDGNAEVPLNPGQTIATIDFGYRGVSSIAGQVYIDTNNDGVRNNGELPIPGTPIQLVGVDAFNNTFTLTTTTLADGSYNFTNLVPGNYTVTETQPTLYGDGIDALGTVDGTPNGTLTNDRFAAINLTAGQQGIRYDFGEIPAAIAGSVFLDRDRDGVLDANEPAIPSVVITLRGPNGTVVGTTTTDAAGEYRFGDLPAGDYTVEESQPIGYGNPPTGPFAPNTRPVTLPPGGNRLDENFADTLADLMGSVYVDANNDGIRQPTELPIPNTVVILVDTGTGRTVGSTTTDVTGGFSFIDLPAGTYRLIETQPTQFDDGRDTPGNLGGTVPTTDIIEGITLAPGSSGQEYLFGELASSLGGISYYDRNNDGSFNAGDRPLAGTIITLRNNGVVVASATTGADGSYLFANLPSGNYTIAETQPNGYGNGQTPSNIIAVTLPVNVNLTGNNFGNTYGSIAGTVYLDYDLGGVYTPTGTRPDTPLSGIVVMLLDGSGNVLQTATTNTAGNYAFAELPLGTYTVMETQPPLPTTLTNGFYDGSDNLGSLGGTQPIKNSLTTTIGVDPNSFASLNGTAYNFGELPPADPFGFVFNDINRNARFDAGDAPIPNVTITLSGTAFAGTQFSRPLTAADVVGGLTRTTDANGRWEFVPIPPGVYAIAETQPAGFVDGPEEVADTNGPDTVIVGNDIFSNVVLAPFPIRGPFNFGEFRVLAQGPLVPIDFFPPQPVVPPTVVDPSKREFLTSTPSTLPVVPPAVAPLLPTSPNFGAFSPSAGRAPQYLSLSEDTGDGIIRVMDFGAGVERFRFRPFPDYAGGLRTSTADVTGDGIPDFVVVPGFGGGPIVRVYDGSTGGEIATWMAFEPSFRGGLQIAAADFNGDGRADIIVTPDAGGGPIVRGYDGRTFAETINFFALDDTFRGGLRLGAGDLNNDNADDLLVTAGVGGGPRVAGYDGRTLTTTQNRMFGDFFAFAPELRNGFWISGGDINGDGFADIVLGAGLGGGPRVAVYSGQSLIASSTTITIADFFGGDVNSRTGARVKALDLTNDGRAEVITTGGANGFPAVYIYDPLTGGRLDAFYAFAALEDQSVYLG